MENDVLENCAIKALSEFFTCDLQWELEKREGIQARSVGIDDTVEVLVNGTVWQRVRGPLTVTINQD